MKNYSINNSAGSDCSNKEKNRLYTVDAIVGMIMLSVIIILIFVISKDRINKTIWIPTIVFFVFLGFVMSILCHEIAKRFIEKGGKNDNGKGGNYFSLFFEILAFIVAVIGVIASLAFIIADRNTLLDSEKNEKIALEKEIVKLGESKDIGFSGCSSSPGLNEADKGNRFYFADSPPAKLSDYYLLIYNPNDEDARITVKYYLPDKWDKNNNVQCVFEVNESTRNTSFIIPHKTRGNIVLNDIPEDDLNFWTEVESNVDIFCERSIYLSYGDWVTGGWTSKGIKEASNKWYFAEGSSQKFYDTWITVVNIGDVASKCEIHFMGRESELKNEEIDLDPYGRKSMKLADLGIIDPFVSIYIEQIFEGENKEASIIAERATYWRSKY